MLNAIPDTRQPHEVTGSFLTPNDIVGGDHADEIEVEEGKMAHEEIDLGERRQSLAYSGNSASTSSGEVPKRNSTVDMGKKSFYYFKKICFGILV
jgi:hypothetical protein